MFQLNLQNLFFIIDLNFVVAPLHLVLHLLFCWKFVEIIWTVYFISLSLFYENAEDNAQMPRYCSSAKDIAHSDTTICVQRSFLCELPITAFRSSPCIYCLQLFCFNKICFEIYGCKTLITPPTSFDQSHCRILVTWLHTMTPQRIKVWFL